MFVSNSTRSQGYQASRSLRFRSSASASLSRTPGTAGNAKLLCGRYRVKRGNLGSLQVIASAGTASIDRLYFDSSDRLCLDVMGVSTLVTTQVFRDPSAFYLDIGFQLDVANGTAGLRAKILVNEVEVSSYAIDARGSIANTNTNWNTTVVHYLGRDNVGNYFDGYLCEPIGVDGSTSVASYIATDATTTQAIAARPSAIYGTNSFYLPFDDPTSTTTLGYDKSGNANHWTCNNISLTAGATYDSLLDVPLGPGGGERGNYATLNPLDKTVAASISNGNLRLVSGSAAAMGTRSTIAIPATGAWYFEGIPLTACSGSNIVEFGLITATGDLSSLQGTGQYGLYCSGSTSFLTNGTPSGSYGSTSGGDRLQCAVNVDAGKVWLGRNDNWFDSSGGTTGNPSTGANPTFTLSAGGMFAFFQCYNITMDAGFGASALQGTKPTGFKALHTGNLTNYTVIASGSFTGNASADGPVIWMNGCPETLTINGNAVTFATHADKLANGFKLRTASVSYNSSGTNTWTATVLFPSSKSAFRNQNAKGNP